MISEWLETHPTGGANRQGDHAMKDITDNAHFVLLAGEAGLDPIEERRRGNVRATIEAFSKRNSPACSAACVGTEARVRRR